MPTELQQAEKRVSIAPRSILLAIGLLLLLWLLFQIRQILLVLLLSCLLAAALSPAIAWLKKRHFPRQLSILGFYLLFLLMAGGVVLLLSYVLVEEGRQFLELFPSYLDSAMRFLSRLPFIEQNERLIAAFTRETGSWVARGIGFLLSTLNYALVILQSIWGIVTLLVFSFYLLADAEHFEHAVLRLFPTDQRETARRFLSSIAKKVGAYVRGQLLVMMTVGVVVSVGLAIVGLEYALVLGVLAFLLDIIPIIGPIVAMIFGILVALGQDPVRVIWVVLVYFAVQQVENYYLIPHVIGRTTGLHPFWILLSILIGGALLGVIGVLLAVPTAITLYVMIEEFYIGGFLKRIEDQRQVPGGASDA